jgi:hypothetical protein
LEKLVYNVEDILILSSKSEYEGVLEFIKFHQRRFAVMTAIAEHIGSFIDALYNYFAPYSG